MKYRKFLIRFGMGRIGCILALAIPVSALAAKPTPSPAYNYIELNLQAASGSAMLER